MKTYLMLMALAVNAWAGATNEAPGAAEQKRMFMEAVLQKQHDQFDEAEAQLKQLTVLQPGNAEVAALLAAVQAQRQAKAADPVNVLKRKLAETIITEVKFREAAALDVVQFLQTQADINLVWLVPAEVSVNPVTLSLKKVPLADVLGFVTQLTGLKYRVDPHAVVIYKPEAAAAANAKP